MPKTLVVTINKNPNMGSAAAIVELGHRQLQKTMPEPSKHLGTKLVSFKVPVDLLSLVLPQHLIDDVAEIEFTYQKDPE